MRITGTLENPHSPAFFSADAFEGTPKIQVGKICSWIAICFE